MNLATKAKKAIDGRRPSFPLGLRSTSMCCNGGTSRLTQMLLVFVVAVSGAIFHE